MYRVKYYVEAFTFPCLNNWLRRGLYNAILKIMLLDAVVKLRRTLNIWKYFGK